MNSPTSSSSLPFADLRPRGALACDLEKAALRVLRSGVYIHGPECEAFEEEFAAYVGARYCVGVASGFDALRLSILALGILGHVLVPTNTCLPSWMAVSSAGSCPIPVEPSPQSILIDPDYLKSHHWTDYEVRAVMPVHLYGLPVNMPEVMAVARRRGWAVIEDCAQGAGAKYQGRHVGTFGDCGCFSFYPTKNLGAYGDGGAVVTNDQGMIEAIREISQYGSGRRMGLNSRLDEMQAAFLRVRLRYFERENEMRQELAAFYYSHLTDTITIPLVDCMALPCWHQFPVFTEGRDSLREHLKSRNIETMVHYPTPVTQMPYYHQWGAQPVAEQLAAQELSLPMTSLLHFEYGADLGGAARVVEAIQEWRAQR